MTVPQNLFVLDVDTDPTALAVGLRLTDRHGTHLGAQQIQLRDHAPSLWEGLFDTRAYVRRLENNLVLDGQTMPVSADQLLAQLGAFLGQHVLGEEILQPLARGVHQRTLLLRLPASADDPLAAAFARVPWEIARRNGADQPLMARNVVIRAVMRGTDAADQEVALAMDTDRPLRVLLVFATAPGSPPLALRLERERLLDMFFEKVLPDHRVEVDVLCHGVSREAIQRQVRDAGGYHVVHWSGHGHHNLLELTRESDGAPDEVTGQELVDLIVQAGGFIPRLVFLSACHSGSLVKVTDWASLFHNLREQREGRSLQPTAERGLTELMANRGGYTGTALELLRAGVPQVVAMRYEVGDAYARRLARRFYQNLFAADAHHPADSALAMARSELLKDERAAQHHSVDHATPLVFGATRLRFDLVHRRSHQLSRRHPRPSPLLPAGNRDLDPPRRFVGRGHELYRLSHEWLKTGDSSLPAVALLQGLAGLGKTALAAEVINLFHRRFDYVLCFQSRAEPLRL